MKFQTCIMYTMMRIRPVVFSSILSTKIGKGFQNDLFIIPVFRIIGRWRSSCLDSRYLGVSNGEYPSHALNSIPRLLIFLDKIEKARGRYWGEDLFHPNVPYFLLHGLGQVTKITIDEEARYMTNNYGILHC